MENPASPKKLAGRYEIREVLGEGGMGRVYRAYDTVVRREVAVKTVLDIPDPSSLQLFYKECDVLASISHPNIVEIFDIGEFEEDGKKKPYFVMPLLPGATLDHFVRKASHRLTVERTVEIMNQACRGLQAAHERGLVHRDLKPSNIFVMQDDSVKIIDFGVAHMADVHTTRAQKGTLLYMSPEQIELKPLTPASDIFSLSVVCYEALTGRHPFQRSRADEVVEAILHQIPASASDLNSNVSQSISRVVHKGMAKQAWHRFASARDFGDTLGKALRNEPIEFFDPERTRPRLQRATKALEEGDYQFAGEILGEIEAEGHMDTSIGSLRRQLDGAVRRKTLAQLLDAAKARFEEEEDPLALQKLQEALQIEPDNATALALKRKIENRRSDRQIENWYCLAKQHIDNHAYPHAHEALQNVLQLRPKEARALQLIAEIDRQEQEYKKLRQEKESLHRAAMDAWEKGDVSSALARLGVLLELDRRAPDSIRESGANYQGFYNEVRSEHDAMNTAYADARHSLAEKNFSKALTTCQAYLTKYPSNAIFQALKYDIEEQQRQEVSAYIASLDRQVEAEPDLDKRVNILREALDRHPGEPHFERALRLVEDKRDLINSIVARAHHHEEQGAFSDALNDWEILRTIYNQYPGLKFEVERLQKRRDQQARIESKARLIEQVDDCLHAGDYARALDALQAAASEFPNDPEFAELEKLAQDGARRKAEAHRLIAEGQELCSQKNAEGIKLLRQAYELDEKDSVARAVLANALVEQAQATVESDWREAEKVANEALDLNPSHPMAKTLRSLILDQKRETYVGECVSQARKLQAAGELSAALSRIEEGLSNYPRELRLIQIQEAVQRDLQTQKRQTRRRDLEELRRMESEADSATDAMARQTLGERARLLAGKYVEDEEVLSSANGLLQKLNLSAVSGTGKISGRPSVHDDATETLGSSPTVGDEPAAVGKKSAVIRPGAAPPVLPAPPSVQTGKPPVASPQQSRAAQPITKAVAIRPGARPSARGGKLIGIAVAVVLLAGVVAFFLHKRSGNAGSQPTPATPITAAPAPPSEPALPWIKLSSDTGSGKVSFDDQPPMDLQESQWTLEKVPPGDHKVRFEGPQGGASFTFSSESGALPAVKGHITANTVLAVIVASQGDHLRVHASDPVAKLSLDGQAPVGMSQDGADLTSVSPGAHELTVIRGSDQYKLGVDAGPAPSLVAFMESGQNVGSLLVITGQDKSRVFLNGKALEEQTQGGQLRIANLEAKNYVVRVAKNGFRELPEQKIRIRKGEQGKLIFDLQPIPHLASLSIQGAASGTTILIDQSPVGTVQPDGSLNVSTINPGDHTLELRRDGFKPKQIRKHFTVGSPVLLAAGDTAMEAAPGELKINFAPPEAQVTLTKPGEPATKVTSGVALSLPGGSYTLTARTSDGVTRSSTVEVVGGHSKAFDLALAPDGMSKWDDAAGWKQEKGSFIHRGGNFVLYGATPASGTFIFSAQLLKGHRLQWIINYVDANNYILCQMDDNNFYRTVTRNGQKTDEIKVPQKGEKKSLRTFQVRVEPGQIVQQLKQGDNWVSLDRWSQGDTNLTSGRFGFYIPGNDQVALSSFSHYANLGAH